MEEGEEEWRELELLVTCGVGSWGGVTEGMDAGIGEVEDKNLGEEEKRVD